MNNNIIEAIKLCIDERAITKIANLCRDTDDCERDNCPFCFTDESCGFTFCAFMMCPSAWSKCENLIEE